MPLFEDPGELQQRDWPNGPPIVVDYLARASRRIRDFLRTKLSLSTNIDCDVQTVRCTHGTEVKIQSRLLAPRGMSIISAGSGQVVENAKLIASGSTARVTVYFASGSGSADVALVLWPEGSASGSGLTYYPCLRLGQLSGTDGLVLTRDSTQPSLARWAPGGGQTDYAGVRRWGGVAPTSAGGIVVTAWGIQAPTNAGAGAGSAASIARNLLSYTPAAATTGSVGGFAGPFTETRPGWGNRLTLVTYTDVTNTLNMKLARQWWGLSSAGVNGLAAGAGASAIHFAVIGYDLGVNGNWQFMTGDGTNYSVTNLGVAVAANSYHRVILDWTVQASPTATIYSAPYDTNNFSLTVGPTTKTTNVTVSTTVNLGLNCTITLLENANKSFYFSKLMLEQN